MFGYISKKKLIKELENEISRNKRYKQVSKKTKDGAMHLGREIALEEVIERLQKGTEINCEYTSYMIHWEIDNIERSLRDILKRLKEASLNVDACLLTTTRRIVDEYVDGDNIKLKSKE